MSAGFTPGPWRVDRFKPRYIIAGDDYLERTFVAFAGRGTDVPSEANARLIAAAPELYEALGATKRDGDYLLTLIEHICSQTDYPKDAEAAAELHAALEDWRASSAKAGAALAKARGDA